MEFIKGITAEMAGGTLIGGGSMWLLMKRIMLKSAIDTTATTAVNATGDVIQTLRDEVCRLSEINTELAVKLNDLQRENINLRQEISDLHTTLNSMNERLSVISMRETDVKKPVFEQNRRKV